MPLMDIDTIARGLKGATKSGQGYVAPCPAHDDHKPSLKISEKDGKILVYCHAGCTQDQVVGALKDRGLAALAP
jgi:rhodanese-related sulfurtransferase